MVGGAVHFEPVPLGGDSSDEIGMFDYRVAEHKEAGPHIEGREQVEHLRRPFRVWAVVKGERKRARGPTAYGASERARGVNQRSRREPRKRRSNTRCVDPVVHCARFSGGLPAGSKASVTATMFPPAPSV